MELRSTPVSGSFDVAGHYACEPLSDSRVTGLACPDKRNRPRSRPEECQELNTFDFICLGTEVRGFHLSLSLSVERSQRRFFAQPPVERPAGSQRDDPCEQPTGESGQPGESDVPESGSGTRCPAPDRAPHIAHEAIPRSPEDRADHEAVSKFLRCR